MFQGYTGENEQTTGNKAEIVLEERREEELSKSRDRFLLKHTWKGERWPLIRFMLIRAEFADKQ